MKPTVTFSPQRLEYLKLLARQYPNVQSACTEIINLKAIQNLPKGTEHFLSDVHGEFEAFQHILNSASGVVREKIDDLLGASVPRSDRDQLATLIYYPEEKLEEIERETEDMREWYRITFHRLIDLCCLVSAKYTRSKVRKAMPPEYAYIIDELLRDQAGQSEDRSCYHERIVDTIVDTGSGPDFVESLAALIKRLAVDRLHRAQHHDGRHLQPRDQISHAPVKPGQGPQPDPQAGKRFILLPEPVHLELLPPEGAHHPHAGGIFLHHGGQRALRLVRIGEPPRNQPVEHRRIQHHHRHEKQHHKRQLPVHGRHRRKGDSHQKRRPEYFQKLRHHKVPNHLYIRRATLDDVAGLIPVVPAHGKPLYMGKQRVPQVFGEILACPGGACAGDEHEDPRQHRHPHDRQRQHP